MRFCYAHRRFALYPQSVDSWNLSVENYTNDFLSKVKSMGFDAIEVGFEVFNKLGNSKEGIETFAKKVNTQGLKIGAIRSGGTLTDAKNGPSNVKKITQAIKYAEWCGAEVVNGALSAPARYPGHPPGSQPGSQHGWPLSQDSSKDAMIWVFERLAENFKNACDVAADVDVNITVEVHQNSPIDNSWAAVLLNQMVDRGNFGINPDLGNILWNYDVPEEDFDQAILAMAPVSKYWHCKNLLRVYHPENNRSVYLRVPLSDGEIDYRFAITAMTNSNYSGYMAIEGTTLGDQWEQDLKSINYAKSVLKET